LSKDVDLLDRHKTFEYIKNLNPTVIIDAAAKVGGIVGNNAFPVEFLSENIRIQTNLMDAARAAKTEKFVFLGWSIKKIEIVKINPDFFSDRNPTFTVYL
jgi:GDP-L-fucose synthase